MSDLKNKPVGARPGVYYRNDYGHLITEDEQPGITLRQYYAGLALQGLLAGDSDMILNDKALACHAVMYADALIAELEKTNQ